MMQRTYAKREPFQENGIVSVVGAASRVPLTKELQGVMSDLASNLASRVVLICAAQDGGFALCLCPKPLPFLGMECMPNSSGSPSHGCIGCDDVFLDTETAAPLATALRLVWAIQNAAHPAIPHSASEGTQQKYTACPPWEAPQACVCLAMAAVYDVPPDAGDVAATARSIAAATAAMYVLV